jgi:cyclopropane-fatty-acyl-phospholipid synthase
VMSLLGILAAPLRADDSSVPMLALASQDVFLEALDTGLTDAVVRFHVRGREFIVGRGIARVFLRVHHPRFFTQVLCYGNLGLGESFMRGDFEMEEGCLHDLLTALLRNRIDEKVRKTRNLAVKVAWIQLWNRLRSRETNVQRHYDIGDDLFEAFLDSSLTYSCGYATTPDDDLEELQCNKLNRICQKIRLRAGDRLLDIGCGFGGLLIFAARHYDVTGTGMTISRRHCERGNAEIARHGLGDRIRIELCEYRDIQGHYDRVTSVGMMEHLPPPEYNGYFQKIAAALKPGGVGLVHTIGCNLGVNEHDPFIQKYIFPGSNQPRLSEIAASMEKNGLAILDVENIVRHYAYTVLWWLKRFQQNRAALDPARYDAEFQKMWEYYLCCGIAAARASDAAVYQVLFHNDRAGEIPLQRV